MKFHKLVLTTYLLLMTFAWSPLFGDGVLNSSPQSEEALQEHRYQLFVINWTPNNSIIKHTKWWVIERLLGRRYVHSSLIIAKVPPGQQGAQLAVDPEGQILLKDSEFHYLSFPDGNRIKAYVKDGTQRRDVLFEAIRINELINKGQLDVFFQGIKQKGYFLPPKWRSANKEADLVDHFKRFTGDKYKLIKTTWENQGVFKQPPSDLSSIRELLAPYSISLETEQLELVNEYIQVVGGLQDYRSNYDMYTNNCVHSVYYALSKLFDKEKIEALGDQNKLSSQILIRRILEAFPGSNLMRVSRTKSGWQIAEVKEFVPQGNRPYLWGGIAAVAASALIYPVAASLR